jgi:hypothetical protein
VNTRNRVEHAVRGPARESKARDQKAAKLIKPVKSTEC